MLTIKNLKVNLKDKPILKGINLKLKPGINVLMGPNGSGKSTLANTLMGDSKYEIIEGEIKINNHLINNLKPNERAKLGLFLSFQYPTNIEGIPLSTFLRESYNNLNKNKLSILEFRNKLEENAEKLGINKEFLDRYINQGSGGEKKKSEILQLLTLNPEIAILDETDSGTDVDSLKLLGKGINEFAKQNKTILLITHYNRILKYLNTNKVFIIKDGKIIKEGDKELADKIEQEGYK